MLTTKRTLSPISMTGKRQEASDVQTDALLQASRRLDWRFLLPHPDLGRVAYVGPQKGTLLASLPLFSQSLIVITPGQDGSVDSYDVVVAIDPAPARLAETAELVRPGGFLYIEGYGLPWFTRQPLPLGRWLGWRTKGLRFAQGYAGWLARLGFAHIQSYWHWPNFESCTKILPLYDQGALGYAFAGTAVSRHKKAQLKASLANWLPRSGLLARLTPCFSLVAQQGVE